MGLKSLLKEEGLHLSEYAPEEFLELYVCALMILSDEGVSLSDAHLEIEELREQLEFEVNAVPPREELH
tara:strand:- start:1290 stop:1496 length:207 start_codon:yes stop_codon:yes gene_type:complete